MTIHPDVTTVDGQIRLWETSNHTRPLSPSAARELGLALLAAASMADGEPTLGVLHVRDADNGCELRTFALGPDGEELSGVLGLAEEDIDPGRGYGRAAWAERVAEAAEDSTPWGRAVFAALVAASESEHIRDGYDI